MTGVSYKIKNVELLVKENGKEKSIRQKVGTGIYENWKTFMKEYYGNDFVEIKEINTENIS